MVNEKLISIIIKIEKSTARTIVKICTPFLRLLFPKAENTSIKHPP